MILIENILYDGIFILEGGCIVFIVRLLIAWGRLLFDRFMLQKVLAKSRVE